MLVKAHCIPLCLLLTQVQCLRPGDKKRAALAELEGLQEQFWQWRLRESPPYATDVGIHDTDDKLEEYNEYAFTERKIFADQILRNLTMIDTSILDRKHKVSADILRSLLESFINGYKYRRVTAYNDISPMDGPLIDFRWTISKMPLATYRDYNRLIVRFSGIPSLINDRIQLMRIAIRHGVTLSNHSLTGVVERLKSLEVDRHDSEFYKKYFENKLPESNLPKRKETTLKRSALCILGRLLHPAFKLFKKFLITEYIPNTRQEIGLASLPNGLDVYKACLKYHLSLEMSPEEIHQTGVREVARIRAEMEKIKNRDGFKGDLKSFIGYLRNQTELFYKTEEEMLTAYREIIEEIKKKIWVFFKKQPKVDVSVRKTENIHSPSSYSKTKLKNGTRRGYFNANVYQPWTRPKFNMMALVLHATYPGHHLQDTYVDEGDLPNFRMFTEWRHMSASPFNWQVFSAYNEGWALYAEYLGEELGLYDEPFSLLGRYASESFRAASLVVDTGIHAKGWSWERAVQYLIDHTTLSRLTIESEVNRYTSWPGQACSYKIGELKIKELREKATERLGSRFDIREFHDQILNLGACPLNVMEETIDIWIQSQTSAASSVFTAGIGCCVYFVAVHVGVIAIYKM